MKNDSKKLFGVIAFAVIMAFMAACDTGNDDSGGDPTNETAGITEVERASINTAFQSAAITLPGNGGLASNQVRLAGLAPGFQYNVGLGNNAPSATAGWQSPNSALTWTITSGSGQASLWVRAIGNTTVGVRVGIIQEVNITQPGGGGYVTINNIPAGFNGDFAILAFADLYPFYIGAANINPNTLNITLLPISNRSVRLPMWKLDFTYEGDYPYDFSIDAVTRLTRTGTPEGFYGDGADPVLMIYSQSSLRMPALWGEGTGTGTVRIARYWSGITFTNGSATLCWNDSFHWDW